MKVLIPILSKQEGEDSFLRKATEKAKEAILLLAVDRGEMYGQFGYAASEIMQGNKLMEEISAKLESRKIKTETALEWGNISQKILNTARLKQAKKIAVKKQSNQYWKKLIEELEKGKGKKTEVEII